MEDTDENRDRREKRGRRKEKREAIEVGMPNNGPRVALGPCNYGTTPAANGRWQRGKV